MVYSTRGKGLINVGQTGHQVLDSLTNLVCRSAEDGLSVVHKRYRANGRRNGFVLPVTRAGVEVLLLQRLDYASAPEQDFLVVPKVMRFDARIPLLTMSDLGGIPLSRCPVTYWPGPEAWAAMGRYCALLERWTDEIVRAAPSGIWQAQTRLRRRVVDRRVANVTPGQAEMKAAWLHELLGRRPVLSLGDFGLTNLLACGNRLGLVDLEFAHLGDPGRDIGRLVAQLTAQAVRNPDQKLILERCRCMLLQGYHNTGGDLEHCFQWSRILGCYYGRPEYAGPTLALPMSQTQTQARHAWAEAEVPLGIQGAQLRCAQVAISARRCRSRQSIPYRARYFRRRLASF